MLEGFFYQEPVDAEEVESLLIRAIVNAGCNDAQAAMAEGLAQAFAEDFVGGDFLTGNEADRLLVDSYVKQYARGLHQDVDEVDPSLDYDVQDLVYRLALLPRVIRAVARARADLDVAQAKAFYEYAAARRAEEESRR